MPITQSAMIPSDEPLLKRLVVDPKTSLKTKAVVNTEHASEALAKATVLTLRLILSAEQIPARAPHHHCRFTAVEQERDEYECIFESDVAADLRNANRDSRSQHGSDEREKQ
jgi:hypothetical protein